MPDFAKFALPASMSASLASLEVATSEPTFTCEPLPNRSPLPLMSTMRPLASSVPKICVALLPPIRLTAIAWAFGWTKVVVCPFPTLKLDQSITTPSLACRTSVVADDGSAIDAEPLATIPPAGFASAGFARYGAATASMLTPLSRKNFVDNMSCSFVFAGADARSQALRRTDANSGVRSAPNGSFSAKKPANRPSSLGATVTRAQSRFVGDGDSRR